MEINGVYIEDTFAEAFPIWVSRVLITAATKKWAKIAATEATGFGCSVIMCPAEAGIEKYVPPSKTPDGRPGFIIQICHPKKSELEHQMLERLGQCVLTCPTTAIFDAMGDMADEQLKVGFKLKFFGDGYEKKDELYGRKVYKIPIMGGEFITEAKFGIKKGVAGGNFFIMADTNASALIAAEAAVNAIASVDGVITPFPGGVVASGSKVGASNPKYKFMVATTNHKMCPTLKGVVEDSEIPEDVNGVYEIVIDGVDEESVKEAMKQGILAATRVKGVKKITAGNYGGKLGKYQFNLRELFE
ncbi:formylmethanofuran:tetrahydromethanopterin formyltransferase (ftr) [Methanocaldococcus jannaschii DSM 2661]|uniref:Formylmethanofuran--tetrahydromethanopterin formyltransferase n=1 Tax=Methanocaldococcus jannaschii (strain ATCC 43067 / DSM 2661 / JAL-1 / JCM 10045 / NBRC 100440) TaxID=243232 RepID=FTR_METJA|nr:formylmethanofuran--tetrahydromethanopterin N-formyltransferase [Methanocaldococcus jannaschii]Q57766.1 RecName: Full=Formylmethanofuran--tetrahydromethanopterin formyltransferase; Short=Ftr; AltName: Full=H4MPT formyltransferase [Methanocaldococcus jannaschii DSM 2661]AAB98303.1 formylmethanofuran:tetrahydromethanopterin formyltransferase (ftr) [Methanocaldococcus jannaschii DSM 2661]